MDDPRVAELGIAELIEALDVAVIEWLPDRTFRLFAPPPPWFRAMTQWASLPFLEHILPEAEAFWRGYADSQSTFGPFTVAGPDAELLLKVRAMRLQGLFVMAIERFSAEEDLRSTLQKARDHALAHEALEEKTRELHAPAEALADAVRELGATELSPEQAPIVDRIVRDVTRLQDVVQTFPAPRRQRRQV